MTATRIGRICLPEDMSVLLGSVFDQCIMMLTQISIKITAFTIPYFSLTDKPPAIEEAPLSPSGVFGIDALGDKYIREEKFSISWIGGLKAHEPSLAVALNPLDHWLGSTARSMEWDMQYSALDWARNNLFYIGCKWKEVLNALDEQTTLPVKAYYFIAHLIDYYYLLLIDRTIELHHFQ